MAKVIIDKKGKEKVLLNPWEKGGKAFGELINNCRWTNDGKVKVDKNGEPLKLTNTQKAYRNGYLQAQKDSRKAWKANDLKKAKQKEKKKKEKNSEYEVIADLFSKVK